MAEVLKNLGYYNGKYDLIENMKDVVSRGINFAV